MMKLSEQLNDLCCGNGAIDRQEAIKAAKAYEKIIELCAVHMENMDGHSAMLFRADIEEVLGEKLV